MAKLKFLWNGNLFVKQFQARPLLAQAMDDANYDTLADARLPKDYDSTEMSRMVTCAAICVRHLARLRPRMSQVVRALEGKMSLDMLKKSNRPGHNTTYGGSLGSSDHDSATYKQDMDKFKTLAFEALELNSSGCSSGPTSEFTQHPSGSSSECGLLKII